MDFVLNQLLTFILIYGYPVIIGIFVLAYLGIPVPLSAAILASGAFTSSNTLNLYILLPLVFILSFLGDTTHYFIGKKWGNMLVAKYPKKLGLITGKQKGLKNFFNNWGGLLIFTSRWLITPLGIPVNLISGLNSYSFTKYLFWVGTGEFLWTGIYIFLGRYLGGNWGSILEYTNQAPYLFLSALGGVLFIAFGIKFWKSKG